MGKRRLRRGNRTPCKLSARSVTAVDGIVYRSSVLALLKSLSDCPAFRASTTCTARKSTTSLSRRKRARRRSSVLKRCLTVGSSLEGMPISSMRLAAASNNMTHGDFLFWLIVCRTLNSIIRSRTRSSSKKASLRISCRKVSIRQGVCEGTRW